MEPIRCGGGFTSPTERQATRRGGHSQEGERSQKEKGFSPSELPRIPLPPTRTLLPSPFPSSEGAPSSATPIIPASRTTQSSRGPHPSNQKAPKASQQADKCKGTRLHQQAPETTLWHIRRKTVETSKTKAPHKPKLKNITPTAVETALGADAPWTATSTPASTGRCRYFVHV